MPFFAIKGAKKTLILSLWSYKIVAGIVFFLIFSQYTPYSSGCDSDIYFQDSQKLTSVAAESPNDYLTLVSGCFGDESKFEKYTTQMEYWNRSFPTVVPNDNRIVIRLNSLLNFISFRFYSVHLLMMAFLSFIGLLLIYKTILLQFPKLKKSIALIVFIIPSTVFWSAGILKEPIIIFLLGVYIYNLSKLCNKLNFKSLLIFSLTIFLMIYTKPYILFILFPISIAYFIAEFSRSKKILIIYFAILSLFGASLYLASTINPDYSVARLLTNKQHDFIAMDKASNAGSSFDIPILDNSHLSLVKNSPTAILNSISRPWIWESKSWPQHAAALENLTIILLILLLLVRFRARRIENLNTAMFALLFGLSLFILSGLSTPNMGALMRYKSVGLPFMFIFLIAGFKPYAFFKRPFFEKSSKKVSAIFWKSSL